MSRYIDAEWLIKESMPLSFSVQKWVNEVQIMTAPSIDIVRCKECKHRGICFGRLVQGTKVVQLNFCSYGQKGDENVETD